jgi:hypothetical protein
MKEGGGRVALDAEPWLLSGAVGAVDEHGALQKGGDEPVRDEWVLA